jgi:MFS family permease
VSFAASSLIVVFVRASTTPLGADRTERRSLRLEIGEGLAWLWHHRLLRTLAAMTGAMNLGFMAGETILVLLAQQRFGLGPVGFGLLGLGGAAGSLAGSVLASRIGRRFATGPLLLVAAGASGLSVAVVGVAPNAWVAGAAFALGGFAGIVWNVVTVSMRQSIIPDRLLGRVNSVYRLLAWGTLPIGAALGGALATEFGLRAAYLIPGVLLLFMPLACIRIVTTAEVNAAKAEARIGPTGR